MKSISLSSILFAALMLAGGDAYAEDIDIYAGNSSGGNSNLLIVLDNSGSWNGNANTAQCPTQFSASTLLSSGGGVQACGLWKAVDAIQNIPQLLGKLNMGVMLLGAQSTNGGVFKFPAIQRPSALVRMDLDTSDDGIAGITEMKSVLEGLKSSGSGSDTSNGRDFGGSTWEAWAFYAGKTGASGAPPYPGINTATCGKNFVIRIGIADNNAQPGDFNANQVKAALNTAITDAGQDSALLNYIPWTVNNKFSDPNNYWADEWTRFMKINNDITTYTITLKDTSASDTQNVSAYQEYMAQVAKAGGGKEFVVDINNMEEFIQALLLIFNEVQAVNSVFASASLPISVNAQGTFLNQIFMGMFRPDAGGKPRWAGNLKQYQFVLDTSDPLRRRLFMADSLEQPAINSAGTGFFSPNAVSFWTSKNINALPDSIDPTGSNLVNPPTTGGFFIFNPLGASSGNQGFDLPDGEVVEKGGVAQQIRLANLKKDYSAAAGSADNPRNVYTCTTGCNAGAPGSNLSATPFAPENTGITTALLGAGTSGTPITSISRSNTIATVTLTAPGMSPVLDNGGTVTVTGSQYPQFNGQVIAGGPPTATSFTYTVTVLPPVTAAGSGFTASRQAATNNITSLSRTGATTATVVTENPHGFGSGTAISISGASPYDGNITVASVVDPNTFTYTITPQPTTPGSGGTAAVQNKATHTISSIVMDTPNGTSPFTARVTVRLSAQHNYAVNETVTISNATPAGYDGAHVIKATGNSCPNATNPTNRVFCFDIDTTPNTSINNAGTVGIAGATANITNLTRTATTCSGGPPANSNATVTATTDAVHSFNVDDVVTVSATSAGPNDGLYSGSHKVVSVAADRLSFTYTIATSPACEDTTNGMTANALGADRDTLIRWVRGEDNFGDEKSPQPSNIINIRPSVHGDVLHSRPAVVAYPSTTDPTITDKIVVFYGSNDGTFRAVNGNKTGNIGTVPPGGELWSFIPPEFFGSLKRLYLNSPVIKLSSTSSAILPAPEPKPYFFDGSIGTFQDLTSGAVYLFLTARRGGRLIYALDVTDPAVPKFMWKRSNADAGFEELGQTWSQPKVALVKGYVDGGGDQKPVLIFGAGYDPAEDEEPPASVTARSMGRGIFILDALTGNIVWQAKGGGASNECLGSVTQVCELADMIYPIPSDVTLVDRNIADESGFVDRLYVPDLGGNIWRVDLEPAGGSTTAATGNTPDKWQITKFADVGGTGTTKRKIFFPPDIVTTSTFDAIMFATGDREHPTRDHKAMSVLNRFYMLKDTNVGNNSAGWTPIVDDSTPTEFDDDPLTAAGSWSQAIDPLPTTGLFNATPTLPTVASSQPTEGIDPTFNATDASFKGFFITLKNAVATKNADGSTTYGPAIENGEKAVNAPTTTGGFTFFGTNTPIPPDPSVCQPNLGTARGYRIDFLTGESKFVVFDGGGLPPSPVAGAVVIDGQTVPFLIGGGNPDGSTPDDLSPVGGQEPPIPITPVRSRIYWYRDIGNR